MVKREWSSNLEDMMWAVYNAQGHNGGMDVTSTVRQYDIPLEAKEDIVKKIKLSPFLTPQEIHDSILRPVLYPKLKAVT